MRVVYDVMRDGLSAINEAADRLAAARQQVATGRRVSVASDDPLAMQAALGERAAVGALDAYRATADSAAARLSAADAVLASMVEKLTGAIVAGTSARGTAVTPAARAAASAEVRSLREALVADINTSLNGATIFAGAAVDRAAYVQVGSAWTYQGDATAVQLEIERGRLVDVTFDGRAIAQGSDPDDMFTVLDRLATAIDAADDAGVAAELAGLDRAFDRVLRAQGRLGAGERAVDDATVRLAALRTAAETRRSALEDANLAEAMTRLADADTAYRAALGAVASRDRLSLLDYLR